MINKREIVIIPLTIIIITFSINLSLSIFRDLHALLLSLVSVAIVIIFNIASKKLMAYNLDCEIEMRFWEIGKYGFKKGTPSKRPFPLGAFLPLISKIVLFPFQNFVWMASLVFDVNPRIYRGAKRHGLYTFSEMTEYHIGLIAAAGVMINIILAIVSYFLGFPILARLSIYYAFFSILPLSELDGNKIFFGSKILWSFLASLILIGMLFAIFII